MIKIEPIAAFNDNYIWCLYDTSSGKACVVDPGQSEPVVEFLKQNKLALESILITHHHSDHVGGIAELQHCFDVTVHGPENPNITLLDKHYRKGDHVTALGVEFKVLEVPGHTLDHIAFYHPSINGEPIVFCGDTLFAGGCGRIFEGTPDMMLNSLQQLASLPDNTQVYCAHEYTLANLAFAVAVEPDNIELNARLSHDQSLRAANTPTVPTTLNLERATNPFLRSHLDSVKQSAELFTGQPLAATVDVFTAIREWKNQF